MLGVQKLRDQKIGSHLGQLQALHFAAEFLDEETFRLFAGKTLNGRALTESFRRYMQQSMIPAEDEGYIPTPSVSPNGFIRNYSAFLTWATLVAKGEVSAFSLRIISVWFLSGITTRLRKIHRKAMLLLT